MRHELWDEGPAGQTFCLAGPHGDDARGRLSPAAKLVWTVDAPSHLAAMTLYYERMGWGRYTTEFSEIDSQTYASHGWE